MEHTIENIRSETGHKEISFDDVKILNGKLSKLCTKGKCQRHLYD